MTNWREAAEKYRQAQPAVAEPAQNRKVTHAAYQLEQFLESSLGREALELLAASRQRIIFGEKEPLGGYTEVYFLDGEGLHMSSEAGGSWTEFRSPNAPPPQLEAIPAHIAVTIAVRYGEKDSENLMRWLRGELDKIAAAAPGTPNS